MTPRPDSIARLRSRDVWDVVVIGGGATGLGSAVEAAGRGYRTLLLERDDFAKGTSSRSTKLVHGGVRYLAMGDIKLVREALRERGLLLKNAPHIAHVREFLVPAYGWGVREYYGLGLWAYDRLAGKLGLGASRRVGPEEAVRLAPTVARRGLRGGVLYRDGQFDDARLAVALARTADDLGATVLNAVAVTGMLKSKGGGVSGVIARDAETGEEFEVGARSVINATGVFADEVRRLDEPSSRPILSPSQGAHVVLEPSFLPGRTALMVPKTDDGRVLFAIPWQGKVVVGTTDTPVPGTSLEPRPLDDEVAFLIKHACRYLEHGPNRSDVLSAFAGLRPLFNPRANSSGGTSKVSREHAALVSESGLVTITGGKWTTYRKMGEDAVGLAVKSAGLTPGRTSDTQNLQIHGWTESMSDSPLAGYGSDEPALRRLIAERAEHNEPIHPRLTYLAGEVAWACRFEAARTVEDVLARRARALFLDAGASAEAAPAVAAIMARELGHDDRWARDQADIFSRLASGYLLDG